MTRTGKIARLPLAIRNELGHRLTDGEPGTTLVTWLNSLPEVNAIMTHLFNGRPITEQNLSEWRKEGGGYDDWLRHQEALHWTLTMREQAAELQDATTASHTSLADDTNTLLLVALTRQLQHLTSKPVESAEDRRDLLAISRELTRLRRVDQRAAMVKLQQDKRADELRREQETKDNYAERNRRQEAERMAAKISAKERVINELLERFNPKEQSALRQLLGHPSPQAPVSVSASSAAQANPAESDQIRPLSNHNTQQTRTITGQYPQTTSQNPETTA